MTERAVRIRTTAGGVELYYPPLRQAAVAVPLGVFGAIACAFAGAALSALMREFQASAGGALAAVLLGAFIVPFAAFGLVLAAQAVYMLANALHVSVEPHGIRTVRTLLGVRVRRRRMQAAEIDHLEPLIASRYQSVFSREPTYHLVALERGRRRRIVVGESLRGAAAMERVRALVEGTLGIPHETPTGTDTAS